MVLYGIILLIKVFLNIFLNNVSILLSCQIRIRKKNSKNCLTQSVTIKGDETTKNYSCDSSSILFVQIIFFLRRVYMYRDKRAKSVIMLRTEIRYHESASARQKIIHRTWSSRQPTLFLSACLAREDINIKRKKKRQPRNVASDDNG